MDCVADRFEIVGDAVQDVQLSLRLDSPYFRPADGTALGVLGIVLVVQRIFEPLLGVLKRPTGLFELLLCCVPHVHVRYEHQVTRRPMRVLADA